MYYAVRWCWRHAFKMPKMYCKCHVIIIHFSRGQAETPQTVDFVFKQSNIGWIFGRDTVIHDKCCHIHEITLCYTDDKFRVRSHVRFVRNPHGLSHFWLVTFQQEWSHGVHCGAVRPANQAKKLPQPRCQKLPQRPLRLKRDSLNTR